MATRKPRTLPYEAMITSGGIGAILSRLYRLILRGIGIDYDRYDALMTRYIAKAANFNNRNERAVARIGLSNELMKESMSWKTFTQGLDFLSADEFELDLLLQYSEDRTTRHIFRHIKLKDYPDSGEILGQFYTLIRNELKITPEQDEELMMAYINRTRVKPSKKDISIIKASLGKELSKPCLSWRTWVKGLAYLNTSKFTLVINIKHQNGRTSSTRVVVSLDDFAEEPSDE